jgi:hypothetical protein
MDLLDIKDQIDYGQKPEVDFKMNSLKPNIYI